MGGGVGAGGTGSGLECVISVLQLRRTERVDLFSTVSPSGFPRLSSPHVRAATSCSRSLSPTGVGAARNVNRAAARPFPSALQGLRRFPPDGAGPTWATYEQKGTAGTPSRVAVAWKARARAPTMSLPRVPARRWCARRRTAVYGVHRAVRDAPHGRVVLVRHRSSVLTVAPDLRCGVPRHRGGYSLVLWTARAAQLRAGTACGLRSVRVPGTGAEASVPSSTMRFPASTCTTLGTNARASASSTCA